MFFTDRDIKKLINNGDLEITVDNEYPDFNPSEQIGASTIDFRLSRIFHRYKPEVNTIDLTQVEETVITELPLDGELIIQPGEVILGLTVERIKLATNIAGIIGARSTDARSGLSVVEQPFIHPGYTGAVALQLYNKLDRPIKVKPLMLICQVMFIEGKSHAANPYSGQFLGERDLPRAPRRREEIDKIKQTEDISVDFAIVTALPIEGKAVLNHLVSYRKKQFGKDWSTYYRGRINIHASDEYYEVVVLTLLGMGNREAAYGSMALIERWHPKNIIMVGIAAGVPNKVALGDIVVADSIYYYELAKKTPTGDQPRGRYSSSDRILYGRARAYEGNDWKSKIMIKPPNRQRIGTHYPNIHFGTIACGDKVIADETALTQLLTECPEMIAVAMEGAGVAGAADHQFYPPRFLEIRSICDYAGRDKNDKWQPFAVEAAAAFTINFLRSGPVEPTVTE